VGGGEVDGRVHNKVAWRSAEGRTADWQGYLPKGQNSKVDDGKSVFLTIRDRNYEEKVRLRDEQGRKQTQRERLKGF
jgi:hypothetical protein